MSYYCISSKVGSEKRLIPHLEKLFEREFEDDNDIQIIFPYKRVMEKRNKLKMKVEKPLLPGYLLLKSEKQLSYISKEIRRTPYSYGLVSNRIDNKFDMHGADIQYADWVFSYNGIIEPSKVALELGTEVRVVSGPLVDCLGEVARVDKRQEKVGVNMLFLGAIRLVWLPIEIVETHVNDEDVKRTFVKQ